MYDNGDVENSGHRAIDMALRDSPGSTLSSKPGTGHIHNLSLALLFLPLCWLWNGMMTEPSGIGLATDGSPAIKHSDWLPMNTHGLRRNMEKWERFDIPVV